MAFVLTELTLGGAELMLWKLLSRIDRARFQPFVIALSPRSDRMLELFRDIGIPCELLGMEASLRGLGTLPRLRHALLRINPDIVQGWLYHGNLAATVGALFWDNRPPVLWNIRGALSGGEKRLTKLIIWLGGRLSFLPHIIINNSMASAIEHEQRFDFRPDKRMILPNGFDTESFRPSPEARDDLRRLLGVPESTLLIGLFGRYHPVKDHANFLRAASLVTVVRGDVEYLLAGEDVDPANSQLRALIVDQGLEGRVHLLGLRSDMPALTAALDVLVSASRGEGFPNVVGEAMSCAVPCVVTNVGDSAHVVADTGRAVPAGDADALSQGILELIDMGEQRRRELGERARQRVLTHFSLASVVRQYEDLYVRVHQRSASTQKERA